MTRILLFGLLICYGVVLNAQKYRTAAGVRLGTEFGITVQQLIYDDVTVEGIVQKGFFNDLTTLTVLGEKHQKILFKGLNFYFGAGPHFAFYANDRNGRENAYGLTLIGGVEMRFNRLLISYDYKPAINFSGGERLFDSQTALSLRYIFIKAKKKKVNWKFWEKNK